MEFYNFLNNKALIAPLVAWTIAQLIKVVIELVQNHRLDLGRLVSSGGMPSSHSATVSALATTIGLIEGTGSVAFAIAVILAGVVLYDSAGVRQSVGKQAVVLNRIIKELRDRRPIAEVETDLKELIGHTAFEVAAGVVLGVGVGFLWVLVIV
ncbi:MAG: divergent PAP2 family protein [Dehalococcoidales bacterium]|nr:divergent PAP2 family protein [Dehalococcoidales bacterium]MDD3264767.1 divergent PAP2 family protein [Dehalococcoidales bacterium]MDD4322804.1 divergent PAP2 family protein [Dehalococcoidales bacterium]MDD4794494.1 divergent PAP2 family protein [Dehalococcoidales bacterium]MDD5122441.1 divergent PAP2 family protein [Dehalococcoidales bacterium]